VADKDYAALQFFVLEESCMELICHCSLSVCLFLALQALSIYMWLSNLLLVKLCAEATTTAAEQTTTVASADGAKAEWRG
jgi:hypothetical protein